METKKKETETELIQLVRQLAKIIKYITMAKKLVKDDKNINKKLLLIRLKIANKER